MRNTLGESIKRFKHSRKRRFRVLSVLIVLSLIVSADVFWLLRQTGLALAGDAACGMEEHTHTEACYEKTLVCSLAETAHIHNEACYEVRTGEAYDETILTCGLTEESHTHTEACYEILTIPAPEEHVLICTLSDTKHTHTDECYNSVLICDKNEHVHQAECYSDKTADVETQLDWQEMFASFPYTGDLAADLAGIAATQLGYTESTLNFELDSQGKQNGYTRYGAWYGVPYGDWSAMFVSFCLHYAGSGTENTPYNTGADSMAMLWNSLGRYAAAGEYIPLAGDLVFFTDNTVGIVSAVFDGSITVIQGDVNAAVCERTVSMAGGGIAGWGLVTKTAADGPAVCDGEEPEEGAESADGAEPADGDDAAPLDLELFVPAACDCGGESGDISFHSDTCACKQQLQSLAREKSAGELCGVWAQLSPDAQRFILQCLQDNAWQSGTKAEELKTLLGQTKEGVTGTCGGASFQIEGILPSDAQLAVEELQYTRSQIYPYIDPDLQDSINWYVLYDISILSGGAEFQPDEPVSVTISSPAFAAMEGECLCVAHVDEAAGNVISSESVVVTDGSIRFQAAGFSPYLLYTVDRENDGGERVLGTNWAALRDSGYFTYWEQFLGEDDEPVPDAAVFGLRYDVPPSDMQVDEYGGSNTSGDGEVVVSKTICGTELENVFDITLTVQTGESISEIYGEPDMAVVIVMDISNSMKDNFGGTTRYAAAMDAAEQFIDRFAAGSGGISRIGYVAFNTDAHEIFPMQPCSGTAEAAALKNTMRQTTGAIINAEGYGNSYARFTNVEAGLKLGADMLSGATNANKYIIFLSDGFPTTYVSSGYTGYNPYTSSGTPGTDGVFYDAVTGNYCKYGTSYSDKASIRARTMASAIKSSDITIFSIGVDVGGQTIEEYERSSSAGFSIIDRTGTSYEIGDASSASAYVNWLQNSIGSGYYYDSTDKAGLETAFDQIFEEILRLKEEASRADWVTGDPLPQESALGAVEFIGFYDQTDTLVFTDLSGQGVVHGENTALFDPDQKKILWDLKNSGFQSQISGSRTMYSYQLMYRVRLKNEMPAFTEGTIYNTNDPTLLTYRILKRENGEETISEQRTVYFPIPAVHGFLSELKFLKTDTAGNALPGAEFTLFHNVDSCAVCRGDGMNPVAVADITAVSDGDGTVAFTGIPSGHVYTLRETRFPDGYAGDGNTYTVTVAYDVLDITVTDRQGEPKDWAGSISNRTAYVFPSTGGHGTIPYILTGGLFVLTPLIYTFIHRRKRHRKSGR